MDRKGQGPLRQALKPVVGLGDRGTPVRRARHAIYQGIEPGAGVVFRGPDRVIATMTFDFDPKGRISAIRNVANPDKLHAVADGTRHELCCTARSASTPDPRSRL
ncbi:hypothetical protein [Streptomyces sp. NPDC058279]|uniref:hypothetical protein n=1 Tax=Streptomyces sp. NPDC058279 TaxID=3346418 RepID=UPI0036E18165